MIQKWIRWLVFSLFAGVLGVGIVLFDVPALEAQSAASGVRVLQSDSNRIVLELNVETYTVRTQRVGTSTFSVITVPGLGHSIVPGKPQLPTQSAMVAIPPGAQASLAIVADEARTDALANPPLPQPTERVQRNPRETLPTYGGVDYILDPSIYNANRAYPSASARIATTGDWRSQHYVVVEFNPLQYNPVTRQLFFHRRLRVELTLTYPRGRTAQSLGGVVNEGAFESVFQTAFVNYSSARNWRAAQPSAPRAPRYSGGPWYKIAVNTDGMYKVTCAQLQSAGINPASLIPTTMQLFDAETELAINVVGATWNTTCGASNYFEFLGRAATSKYSLTNFYWLTFGQATGKRMPVRDGTPSGTPVTVFSDTVRMEENHYYQMGIPWEESDHWFWNYIYPVPYSAGYTDYAFQLPRFAAGTYSATLLFNGAGLNGSPYTMTLALNSNWITTTTWSHPQAYTAVATFSQNALIAGNNTLRVQNDSAIPPIRVIFANFFQVEYNATLTAVTDTLRFRQANAGMWQYPIANFSNATIRAYDVTDPYSVTRFSNTSVTGAGSYTMTFGDNIASAREYFALTDAQFKAPASIVLDTNANLRTPGNSADYIVIAPTSLLASVQPLVIFRSTQGLRSKLVDVQDVYDEFADGLQDPQAIRDFLFYAYTNWTKPAPSMVLLVGDGTYDPLGYCANVGACPDESNVTPPNSTLIPPDLRFVDPYIGETATDNRLVAFGGTNTLPYLAIGRLPVNNATETTTVVNKILANEQTPPNGAWRGKLTFVTDNTYKANGSTDSAGDFWSFSDQVAGNPALVPLTFDVDRIYYNPCVDWATYPWCALANPPYPPYSTTAVVRSALNSQFNSGRLIVNYVGHGFVNYWAGDTAEPVYTPVFQTTDVASLANGSKNPMMLEMTCYTGYFHSIKSIHTSLAEANVRVSGKGALASWSATGLGVATGHDFLHRGFYQSVMSPGAHQIGPATVAGKLFLHTAGGGVATDLFDTFILLGDPASRLAFQPNLFMPMILK